VPAGRPIRERKPTPGSDLFVNASMAYGLISFAKSGVSLASAWAAKHVTPVNEATSRPSP